MSFGRSFVFHEEVLHSALPSFRVTSPAKEVLGSCSSALLQGGTCSQGTNAGFGRCSGCELCQTQGIRCRRTLKAAVLETELTAQGRFSYR